MKTTYELPGSVLRFAKRIEDAWTAEQNDYMKRATSIERIRRTVPDHKIFSPETGLLIAEIPGSTYDLVVCIMEPDLMRYEDAPDIVAFKTRYSGELKVVQGI